MEYTTEILDRRTGELATVSLGEYCTISEYGLRKGVGPNQTRAILLTMGLLAEELDNPPPKSGRRRYRRRLTPDAVLAGLGKRLHGKRGPFDVLSPAGQRWADERWDDAVAQLRKSASSSPAVIAAAADLQAMLSRREDLKEDVQGQIRYLLDRHPDLMQSDIARIVKTSKQFVSSVVKMRNDDIRRLTASKRNKLEWLKVAEDGAVLSCAFTERSPMWQVRAATANAMSPAPEGQ